MALDPYSSCPCGSGKKFKWCCEPIYAGIDKALRQEQNGQHDTALRLMDEVVAAHPGNPEVWGRKAELLYRHGNVEEAEKALEKAFALNPNYPYGLFLRATVRFQEGEIPGALILARKAADAYDPEAHDHLASVYALIYECEATLNHPVAARAALRRLLHLDPSDEDLRSRFDAAYGPDGGLPACARQEYKLLPPPASVSGARRAAWDAALAGTTPRLGDLARAFDKLTKEDDADAAAWFNLGLAQAWLGDNCAALQALDRYLDLENDEAKATTAATLTEVLRVGAGLEDETDYQNYAFVHQIRPGQPVQDLLNGWAESHRLVPLETQQPNAFVALLLEHTATPLITAGAPAADTARLAGYLFVGGGFFQITSPLKEPFERLRDEVRSRLALGLNDLPVRRGPISFQDVVAEALVFPLRPAQGEEERVQQQVRRYYEETWVNRPRRSLNNNTPADAATLPKLRNKLRGVIQFIQDCAVGGVVSRYDFDRLRRQLGLLGPAPSAAAPAGAAGAVGDIGAMGAAELAALQPEALSDEQLEQAYQAAHKLDAGDLAGHFVKALLARPANTARPDRYPWYSFLLQQAVKAGRLDDALDLVNEGEKADCEQNEGRRRDDYELRRGQVHVKRGEAEQAADVFARLTERVPSNTKYRGAAAEAMLALRQPAKALRFVEEGLAAARQQNDRDSEGYLLELEAAAKKQLS